MDREICLELQEMKEASAKKVDSYGTGVNNNALDHFHNILTVPLNNENMQIN